MPGDAAHVSVVHSKLQWRTREYLTIPYSNKLLTKLLLHHECLSSRLVVLLLRVLITSRLTVDCCLNHFYTILLWLFHVQKELLYHCKFKISFSGRLCALFISALQVDLNSDNTRGCCVDWAFKLGVVMVLTHPDAAVWWLFNKMNNSGRLVICQITFLKCLWGKRKWSAQLCGFWVCRQILDNSCFRQPPILAGDTEIAPILVVPSLMSPGISHQNAHRAGTSWEGNGSQR